MKTRTKLLFLFLLLSFFIGITLSIGGRSQGEGTAVGTPGETDAAAVRPDTANHSDTTSQPDTAPQPDTVMEKDLTDRVGETGETGNPPNGTKIPRMPSDSFSFIKTLMALTFVLGLIFLAAYFFKKLAGIKTTGMRTNRVPIRMVGYLPLGDKKFLSIVEIQGKHYFLGISQESINMLSPLELELSPEMNEGNEDRSFESIFKKARSLLKSNNLGQIKYDRKAAE